LHYIDESKKEFWKKWMVQVFQGQVLSQKWRKQQSDAQAGEVVLIKSETATRWSSKGGWSWRVWECEIRGCEIQKSH
jgi:hypothetical protein